MTNDNVTLDNVKAKSKYAYILGILIVIVLVSVSIYFAITITKAFTTTIYHFSDSETGDWHVQNFWFRRSIFSDEKNYSKFIYEGEEAIISSNINIKVYFKASDGSSEFIIEEVGMKKTPGTYKITKGVKLLDESWSDSGIRYKKGSLAAYDTSVAYVSIQYIDDFTGELKEIISTLDVDKE
jgi:hypothetical protein